MNMLKDTSTGFKAVFVFWLLYVCASLAAVGALAYVAWHFIAKFW